MGLPLSNRVKLVAYKVCMQQKNSQKLKSNIHVTTATSRPTGGDTCYNVISCHAGI